MSNLTMKEIAIIAGVSQPTVSRVINGKPVKEALAKRVQKAIDSAGYVPNKAAQTLKRNKSFLLGVCVSQTYNPYFVELIDALETETRNIGYSIILHNSKHNPMIEWDNISNFAARQVDGIILVPTSDINMERIKKLNIPTVVITQNNTHFDSVSLNYLNAGRISAERFLHAGHRKFGFIGHASDEKFVGYNSMLYENGIDFEQQNYIEISLTSTDNFSVRQDIERYFNLHSRPNFTCISTTNDIAAFEFMKAAQERGIRIPEDISVIGFDDTYLSKMIGVSSIHQPIEKMVETAIRILQDRIESSISGEIMNILLEPTLVDRRSSL